MNERSPQPTEINYHQTARLLEIVFDTNERFELTAEYLRVFSPSAEVRGHGPGQEILQLGKENVRIENIEPVGNYAIGIHFDDGHNTGIYSFEELYELAVNQEAYWQNYLQRLAAAGHRREQDRCQ